MSVSDEERLSSAPATISARSRSSTRVRSATITADTDLLCCGMTAWEFRPFVEEHPEVAWVMLQTLARRLREAQAHEHTH